MEREHYISPHARAEMHDLPALNTNDRPRHSGRDAKGNAVWIQEHGYGAGRIYVAYDYGNVSHRRIATYDEARQLKAAFYRRPEPDSIARDVNPFDPRARRGRTPRRPTEARKSDLWDEQEHADGHPPPVTLGAGHSFGVFVRGCNSMSFETEHHLLLPPYTRRQVRLSDEPTWEIHTP